MNHPHDRILIITGVLLGLVIGATAVLVFHNADKEARLRHLEAAFVEVNGELVFTGAVCARCSDEDLEQMRRGELRGAMR